MRVPQFQRLLRIKRRMNAAEHDVSAALAREASHGVAAQRIAGVDADADDVAGRNALGNQTFKSFVTNLRIAKFDWRRGRQHVQPTWRDDGGSECGIAGVYQMDRQRSFFGYLGRQTCRLQDHPPASSR